MILNNEEISLKDSKKKKINLEAMHLCENQNASHELSLMYTCIVHIIYIHIIHMISMIPDIS